VELEKYIDAPKPLEKSFYRYVPLILITFCFCLFANSLTNTFVNYDDWWFVHNPEMLSWLTPEGLWKTFFDFSYEVRMEHGAQYVPITDLFASIQYRLFRENSFPYHLVQTGMYAVSGILFFQLLAALGLSFQASLLSTLFFIVHPIHVESVAWLSSHKDLLSLVFFLACLLSYCKQVMYLALLFFVLGIGSKYQVLLAPLFFPFVDRCLGRPVSLKKYLPFFIISVASYLVVNHVAEVVRFLFLDPGKNISGLLRNVFGLFDTSLKQLVTPLGLQIYYPFEPSQSWMDVSVLRGMIEFMSLLLLTVWGYKKKPPFALASVLMIFMFFPMLRSREEHLVADRYLLFSSIGYCMLLGLGISLFPRKWAGGLTLLLVVGGSFLTVRQNRVWASSVALWENAARGRTPVQRKVWENLAVVYRDAKEWKKSREYFEYLIKTSNLKDPLLASHWIDLGYVLIQLEEFNGAQDSLLQALKLDSNSPKAHLNLGVALAMQGRRKEAKESMYKAKALEPSNPEIYFNLARMEAEEKNYNKVRDHLVILKKLAPLDFRTKLLEKITDRKTSK